jgi:uncharacterized ferritin-like protein (DUF455 family)
MRLYQEHIQQLGFALGAFPVRDWFWQRVPTCTTPLSFVAVLGMGLEAANLEHSPRFATWFAKAGDHQGAKLQQRIAKEEVAHVRFAVRWFNEWSTAHDFDAWRAALPLPLSPLLMRGKTINRQLRQKAGMSLDFIDALANYRAEPRGRS